MSEICDAQNKKEKKYLVPALIIESSINHHHNAPLGLDRTCKHHFRVSRSEEYSESVQALEADQRPLVSRCGPRAPAQWRVRSCSGKHLLHLSIVIFPSLLLRRPLVLLCSSTSLSLFFPYFSGITFTPVVVSLTTSCAVCCSPFTLFVVCLLCSSMFEVIGPDLDLAPLLQNSVSFPFPVSCPTAPRSSSSSATRMAWFQEPLSVTWPGSRSLETPPPHPQVGRGKKAAPPVSRRHLSSRTLLLFHLI